MIPDPLYEAAFKFRKTKLWQQLYDTQLYAVEHADGTIGYCCVMGKMDEHLALAVYPGAEGLASYRRMGEDSAALNEYENWEIALSQRCVMISFENKDELRPRELEETRAYCAAHGMVLRGKKAYPQFQCFRPHYFPWYVEDENDQAHLLEGLAASLHVAEILESVTPEEMGFTNGAPYDRSIPLLRKNASGYTWAWTALPKPVPVSYPAPKAHNELALAKLSKTKKRGTEWACDIFMHTEPMTEEDVEEGGEPDSAPFYPYVFLIVDNKTGELLSLQLSDDPENYSEVFTQSVLECAQISGMPSHILVCNERAYSFFQKLSGQLHAALEMRARLPFLEETREDFLAHAEQGEDALDEDMAAMLDMLHDPQKLAQLPASLLRQLGQITETGVLPEDIIESIKRECARRGMP